ncbi:multidrug resistance protein Stp [Brucella sp. NBRC 12951]|uniref:MFS transporter n=1 Tax=Brucella TaxID=234 RepID=UPI0015FC16C8|nr:MFS transporter [Brucella anthropi]MBA8861188.1 EmrB/QacA subfamily drug resistance transporter [Brucella anthropi]QTN05345.1 MFS transporter [Ochrobactrum sp. EEELCW01]
MTTVLASAPRVTNSTFILLTASTGCAVTVLDTNVVAMVLPTIAREFSASFADVEWVISTYVLCFASLLLPAGALADRFGRRTVFLIGIGAFAFSSWLCGVADSATSLYLARALQGASAAFQLAPALAIIGHTFHRDEERNRAWSIWGGIMGLTMVLSPIIGGLIAHSLGWRWAFYINIPIGIVLALATLRSITDSKDENARRVDPIGIVAFASTMFGLTWGLINGQAHGWTSSTAIAGFVGGLAGLAIFLVAETVQQRPMLDLSLFRNPRFIGGVWAMFAYAACAQVMASMLPLFLQNGFGQPPLQAGFAMLPFASAMLIFPNVGRFLGKRMSSREILSFGLMIVGIGSLVTSFGAHSGAWSIVMSGMFLIGSGGGLLNGETQKAIMSTVARDRAGMASGISTTARFTGILLGFAVLSGVLASAVRTHLMQAGCNDPTCRENFADAIVAGDLPNALGMVAPSARIAATELAMRGYSAGFSVAILVSAIVAIASSLLVYCLMKRQ